MSIARLAQAFRVTRTTVVNRLTEAGVKPDGKRNGYEVYPLRESALAILDVRPRTEDGMLDPRHLPPDKRNSWYQSEQKRVALEVELKNLVPAAEVEAQMSVLVTSFVRFLNVLPDLAERDANMSPEQVIALQSLVNHQRNELHVELTAPEVEHAEALV